MPKPNQTMLDQLVKTFKSTGTKKPQLLRTTYPVGDGRQRMYLSYEKLYPNAAAFEHRVPDLTPERVKYQRGIDARIAPRHEAAMQKRSDAYDLKDEYENEWRDAVEEAKSDMADDWSSTLDYQDFDEVNPDILEDVQVPSSNLRDYWPSGARSPDEIYEDFDAAQDAYYAAKDAERELFTPAYRMQEQMMTPRYRNYQRAMRQRQENAQVGRLNAAIMNLYRQGYSMPEIREILRNQRIR